MDKIKRLMVGLDLTDMDKTLLRYTKFLSNQSAIEKIYLVHAEKSLDLPQEMAGKYKAAGEPATEQVRSALDASAEKLAAELPQTNISAHVVDGNPVKGLLTLARQEEVDLLLVGRKLHAKGSGVLPEKLLRSSRMSVLFIPENAEPVLHKIVVSVDFSDYSLMALDRVLHSALALPEIEIECLHVYHVPPGYITLGVSYEDFDTQMQEIAREKFERVLEQFPELVGRATLNLVKQERDTNMGNLIVLEAKRSKADLLVIGAKGMSATALFILGSVTEKILNYDNDIPLLVFKNKNEKLGFIDALIQGE